MNPRWRKAFCKLAAIAIGGMAFWPRSAAAQAVFGLETPFVAERNTDQLGAGADLRFGYRIGVPRSWIVHNIAFQPELLAGYLNIPSPDGRDNLVRFGGGGRIGVLIGALEPFVVGHISAAYGNSHWGHLGDFGGAADLRWSNGSVGAGATYGWIWVGDALRNVIEFGPHVEVHFFL
jgi:hypothetical protein